MISQHWKKRSTYSSVSIGLQDNDRSLLQYQPPSVSFFFASSSSFPGSVQPIQ